MIRVPRSPVLAVSLIAALAGCEEPPHIEELDLGVDVRLDDVESASLSLDFLAVGAGGIVVDQDGQQWDLGDAHLRAVEFDILEPRWWVAGDGGFVAFANHDDVLDWVVLDVPTDADIEAIGLWRGEWSDGAPEESPPKVVLVGADILLVGEESDVDVFEWIEPNPPDGGWGRLRDVMPSDLFWVSTPMWAVGEQGRMLLSQGSPYDWVSVDSGTNADLNCGMFGRAHGDGVLLERGDNDTWFEHPLPGVEVIGCAGDVIGTDRRIYDVDWSKGTAGKRRPRYHERIELDWQPRAFSDLGNVIVGDGGHVARL